MVLDTSTKKFLAALAASAFLYELAALWGVLGAGQPITTAMVELSCDRPWIPYWLGALLAHFFFPRRDNPRGALTMFLLPSFAFVAAWEVLLLGGDGFPGVPGGAVDWLCDRMWLSAGAGMVAGHLGFTRPIIERRR